MNTILIIAITLLVSACEGGPFKPRPTFFKGPEPGAGGPIYQKAFKEGCDSGFSVYGNDYWRVFYSYTSDIELMQTNKLYSRVWWDSFNFCRHYINRYLMDGYFGSEGFNSGQAVNFNESNRNTKIIEIEGFSIPGWAGFDTPGWGEQAFGGALPEGDWLWRDEDKVPDLP